MKRDVPRAGAADGDPEGRLLARERRARLAAAIDRLDGRQRTVFMLCHYGDCTPRGGQRDALGSTNRRFACTCSGPRASCAACWEAAVKFATRTSHDERLFDCYLAAQKRRRDRSAASPSISPTAPPAPRDTPSCRVPGGRSHRRRCRGRRGVPGGAAARAAAADCQRIEHVGRPARVISFPGQPASHVARRAAATPPRWLAAAAAAGLFVGVVARRVVPNGESPRCAIAASSGRRASRAARPDHDRRPRAAPRVRAAWRRRRRRSCRELEVALERPRTRELPRIRRPHARTCAGLSQSFDAAVALADLPQRPRPQACRRRHAGRELSQRIVERIKADDFTYARAG